MANQKPFLRIFTERGPLIALSVASAILLGITAPAYAQFFNFGGPPPPPRGGFFSPFGDVFPGAPQPPRADYSRAPAPAKRDTPAERNILVLGDSMSDWLGYGLEDAFSESTEFGVVRRSKTISGLIKYQPKGDPADWVAAAKQIVANEKPDAIVVMLGLHDRIPIREPVVEKKADAKPAVETGKKAAKKDARKDSETKSGEAKPGDAKNGDDKSTAASAKPDDEEAPADDKPKVSGKSDTAEAEAAPDDDDQSAPAVQQAQRPGNGVYDFREERWVELYAKKIAELIAVLKTKNVPILWVGLPALKGTKSTSDMLFLDSLYRDGAGKAGITYVDIWDGFVDEQGRYIQQGPDFEGQIRRLRSYDGVYFTKAGARKLALFTEREIRRVLGSRAPVALPSETQSPTPDASNIRPGVVGPRPLAGPIVPLIASSVGTDELLGGNGSRPASVDALAARTLVKGEALSAPAGRADDSSWPRRDVGSLAAPPGDPAVSAVGPDGVAKPVPPKPKRQPPQPTGLGFFRFDTNRGWSTRPRAEAPGFFTR